MNGKTVCLDEKKIKKAMAKRNYLDMQSFSFDVGVTSQTIYNIFNGRPCKELTAMRIAFILGVELEYLLKEEEARHDTF